MPHYPRRFAFAVAVACGTLFGGSVLVAADGVNAPPAVDEVRAQTIRWVATQRPAAETTRTVGEMWGELPADLSPRDLLDRVIATFAAVDPETKQFLAECRLRDPGLLPPDASLLERDDLDEFYVTNLRLHFARHLAQRKMYDEALEQFAAFDPSKSVDPATALFFKAVCEHQLLLKDEGLATIGQLTSDTESVPQSYSTVATLMQYELEALRPDTLDEVSRLMKDSERRLDLARTGPDVQRRQDQIIAKLDLIIEKLEQQAGGGGGGGQDQGQGQGQGQGPPSGNNPSSPATESQVGGQRGPGEVDPQNFRNQGGWGNLPEKEREKAASGIVERYPGHYDASIENYFRRLANQPAPP
ncbi:MAG: hypothetical protein WD066_10865 [Planctomycetaceae bacterium]